MGLRARGSRDRCCQGKLEEQEGVDKERGAGLQGGETSRGWETEGGERGKEEGTTGRRKRGGPQKED